MLYYYFLSESKFDTNDSYNQLGKHPNMGAVCFSGRKQAPTSLGCWALCLGVEPASSLIDRLPNGSCGLCYICKPSYRDASTKVRGIKCKLWKFSMLMSAQGFSSNPAESTRRSQRVTGAWAAFSTGPFGVCPENHVSFHLCHLAQLTLSSPKLRHSIPLLRLLLHFLPLMPPVSTW